MYCCNTKYMEVKKNTFLASLHGQICMDKFPVDPLSPVTTMSLQNTSMKPNPITFPLVQSFK